MVLNMNTASSLRIDLEAIPKELLARLQNYGVTFPENKISKEDSEVQKCLENNKTENVTNGPRGVLSPKSTASDDDVFRFSPKPRIQYVTLPEENNSNEPETVPASPKSVRDHCTIYGDNSDWMLIEKLKSRSPPPSSPDTTSRRFGNMFNFSHAQNSNTSGNIERPPKRSFSQSSIHDIEHTPTKQTLATQESNYHRLSPSIERTPIKDHINLTEMGYQRLSPSIERTPIKQMQLSQDRSNGMKSIYTRTGSEESILSDRVPSPFVRDSIDSSKLSPEQQSILLEELSRRGVKKQLSFESHHYGNEDQFLSSRDAYLSPCQRRNQQDRYHSVYDSDVLINQLLSRLNQIKRRNSDDCCCDYDNDRVIKRKRTECNRHINMTYRRHSDDTELSSSRQQEPEVRPENCTCAVMEKQFLQMAENAYKNIRRKDSSAEGFEQFRKELVATNEVLKDSLNVLKNMKEMCEHRFVTS